jgi:sulfur-oxidizing protein SoxY
MFRTLRCLTLSATVAALALGCTGPVFAADADAVSEATWASIEPDIFGARAIDAQPGVVTLEAPTRAEDAALVPVDIHIALPQGDKRTVNKITLVVDENPSPLVATFTFGEGQRNFDLSTRVRVNSYSFVRVVAETNDGTLHMTKAFVKAAGGCSAPAVKDPTEAKANLGRMRFRVFHDTGRDEAQAQIRHPNNSGMQMDQLTRLYTPAWFVQTLSVKQGDKVLFSMDGGISISEDPTFRFSYHADGQPVTVEAKDTDGNVFKKSFAGDGNS